jgi:hypothetical protein
MLRDARHDDKDEEKEKKMATGSYFLSMPTFYLLL